MKLTDKETMDKISANHQEAKKHFHNRALLVIETLCGGDIVSKDIDKLKDEIYGIAHCAIKPTTCEHEDWIEETEKMFKSFEKAGLI